MIRFRSFLVLASCSSRVRFCCRMVRILEVKREGSSLFVSGCIISRRWFFFVKYRDCLFGV